ncbi:YdcF family protein [Streptomyces tagetis]|uniref:YdcF family protein n=1 Tax=Streptomyces tagetis TaxID=2820809 RepID=A0A941AYJ9_9ACTN|nr:YdcF family protein [Streptomyces sp. RG38]MBQ0825130.1 YdcF family protein [Streptomyces sp. RG38]
MGGEELSAEQVREIVGFVDVEAPPPRGEPTAHFIFGTNQSRPAEIAAERYHKGLAPLIIVSGGINRHTGIVEADEFRKLLVGRGVPDSVVRCEDQAANTWQNVEFSLPYVREAVESGLKVTAISKWYHRRTVHCLATLVPELDSFYALSWEPVYAGKVVSRVAWPSIPDGRRRVIREWEEVSRRVTEGSFKSVNLVDGIWRT